MPVLRPSSAKSERSVAWTIIQHFSAPLIGGFVLTYGFVALATLACFALGLRFFEAQSLAWMLSFIVYLTAILWGFAQRSAHRVWLTFGGFGGLMIAAAWTLSRVML